MVNIENVPTDKNTLDIEIESVPAAANFELICLSNDTEISRTKITAEGSKVLTNENGVPTATINKKVSSKKEETVK